MTLSKDVSGSIRKYAIKNAMDYGKASAGNVLNKIIFIYPELKPEMKALSKEVATIVGEVNSLGKEAVGSEYSGYSEEFSAADAEKAKNSAKPKFILEGVSEGDFVGRASPEPSGYAHMGHAKQALLNHEFSRIYKGKVYLYFDDTNPEKCRQEYVDAIKRDFLWLGIKFDKEYYASDNVEKMYDYARQLIKSGRACVCQCDREEMKKNRMSGTECSHRRQDLGRNIDLFEDMIAGRFEEGQAVVRFNGNISSQNTVLRDPVMLRIVNLPHYRQGAKYHVWPLYDFNTPIMDSINGITDIIRSKEYELRDELTREILGALHLRVPRMHIEARLNIKGNVVQKRVIRKLIADGLVKKWDDPRLMTIMSLRRRGVQPEALRKFVLRFGMSHTDSTVSIDMLLAENKKIIEPLAKHLFFVKDPIKLTVNGIDRESVSLKLHPSGDLMREYSVGNTFYISGEDAKGLAKGNSMRLKDLMDIDILSNGTEGIIASKSAMQAKGKIVQWVSEGNHLACSVLIPGEIVDGNDNFNPNSLATVHGYVEGYAKGLEEHDIVQFERFGYCILDDKKTMQFILTSG
ncbi:MAG: glutamate--tRNA ligase [Candidatus Marsarchaeota archaeon]|nr:glutamate--tRNA ligase [Candidatus Marsarchaeota archaeon]MCL5413382.1 glutamate--tRNA ligase [Candidatus Marsarchaeota archaeon]